MSKKPSHATVPLKKCRQRGSTQVDEHFLYVGSTRRWVVATSSRIHRSCTGVKASFKVGLKGVNVGYVSGFNFRTEYMNSATVMSGYTVFLTYLAIYSVSFIS